MNKQDEQLREGMARFERVALEQAKLSDRDSFEAKWVGSTLRLAARLCCALRASVPGEAK